MGKFRGKSAFSIPSCALALIVIAASIGALAHVWLDLFHLANRDSEASHIALVPFIFVWLVWIRRERFAELDKKGFWIGIPLIVAGMLAHEIGLLTSTVAAWHFSTVLLLYAAFCLSFGTKFFRLFLPAIVVLVFLVPIPGMLRQQISLPIQFWSATITQTILSSAGVDISQNGCLLSVNGVQVTIAEACNGMRMLFSILLVVYTLAFSIPLSDTKRAIIILVSPVIAMFMNVFRLVLTVAMYGTLDEYWAELFHDANGWLIPITTLFIVLSLVGWRESAKVNSKPAAVGWKWNGNPWTLAMGTGMLSVLIVANSFRPPATQEVLDHQQLVSNSIENMPFAVGEWIALEEDLHQEELKLLKPIASFRRTYRNLNNENVVTLVAIASGHTRDLIGHEPGICFVGQGWQKVTQQSRVWQFENRQVVGTNYQFRFSNSQTDAGRRVVSILITPDGATTGDPYHVAKVASDFRLEPFGAAAIQLHCDDEEIDEERWNEISQDFVNEFEELFVAFEGVVKW